MTRKASALTPKMAVQAQYRSEPRVVMWISGATPWKTVANNFVSKAVHNLAKTANKTYG